MVWKESVSVEEFSVTFDSWLNFIYQSTLVGYKFLCIGLAILELGIYVLYLKVCFAYRKFKTFFFFWSNHKLIGGRKYFFLLLGPFKTYNASLYWIFPTHKDIFLHNHMPSNSENQHWYITKPESQNSLSVANCLNNVLNSKRISFRIICCIVFSLVSHCGIVFQS